MESPWDFGKNFMYFMHTDNLLREDAHKRLQELISR